MSMTLHHQGLPDGVSRYELLNALEAAKDIYGLEEIDIRYLRMALGKVNEEDCQNGRICGFWDSVAKLSDRLGTNTRRINRIESRLDETGFITRSILSNRRRWGERKEGAIVELAGINLAPLLNRAEEIIRAARAVAMTNGSLEKLRKDVVSLIRKIRALKSNEAVEAMYEVDKRLRATEIKSIERLKSIIEGLTLVLESFSEIEASRTYEAPQSGQNVRPNTYKQKSSNICRLTPGHFRNLASREFTEALEMYRAEDWKRIVQASTDYAQTIGISRNQWHKRCNELGAELACLCLLIADRNAKRDCGDKFRAKNAPAAFNGMAYKEARERGVLHALLMELHNYVDRIEDTN